MKLSRDKFEELYQDSQLTLAFVGMSNIGKSYTASRLKVSHKFNLIEVDKLIWESLDHESMEDFAAWQGHPYSEGYKEREAVSIKLEKDATLKALDQITGNSLLDTTGSVIYTGKDVINQIKSKCFVVHIRAEETDLERLKRDYFAVPKPLVWKDSYIENNALSKNDNIKACYPNLLMSRKQAYEELADATLTSSFILNKNKSEADIFQAIRAQCAN